MGFEYFFNYYFKNRENVFFGFYFKTVLFLSWMFSLRCLSLKKTQVVMFLTKHLFLVVRNDG